MGRFEEQRRQRLVTRLLFLASVLACSLLCVRVALSESLRFVFLPWNLLLAWIPYLLALGIDALAARVRSGRGLLILPVALWALFLPNAPYILSDVVHLRSSSMPLLPLDTLLILSFALPALALGLFALGRIHRLVEERVGPAAGWTFVCMMLLLTGTGIWLGRVVRLNSWDVLTRPWTCVERVVLALRLPGGTVTACAFTFAFGALLLLLYAGPRLSAEDER